MNTVNIVHINGKAYRMDDMSKEKQNEIWKKLNQQALEAIGYKLQQDSVREEINDRTKKDSD